MDVVVTKKHTCESLLGLPLHIVLDDIKKKKIKFDTNVLNPLAGL